MKNKKEFEFCTKEEIIQIVSNLKNERLVFIDNGIDEVIGKFKDLPDIIVDMNRTLGLTDLKIYEFAEPAEIPIITTKGEFLDKCTKKDRNQLIERLVRLQLNEEEIKKYKLIDEVEFVECCKIRDEER